jgi:O-antigen/teichoic acid export membrane protein
MTAELSPRQEKWLRWFRLLAGFGSVQMAIQILGFLSGILIVRYLSKPDYAWFTIANTFVSTLGMLADSGISGALSAIGGTVWEDDARFGSLIRTALTLRRKLAIATGVVVTPIFIWLLEKNDAPAGTIAVVVATGLLGFSFQLTAGILGTVISLRQEIRRMQSLGLATALFRLAVVASACLVFIDVRVAVAIGTFTLALQAWTLRRWVSTSIQWNAALSADYRGQILAVVRKQAPLTIFYCLQGQIIVWLISIFGTAQRVAEVGALGRFAMMFSVITAAINGIVVPRFARCQDRDTLRRRYWQVMVGVVTLTGALAGLAAIFPRALLWVLGAKYASLENEVWLMMVSASLAAMGATLYSLNSSKAWIAPARISIPMEIVTVTVLILWMDISTVRGVLYFTCLSYIPPILLFITIAYLHLRKKCREESAQRENE